MMCHKVILAVVENYRKTNFEMHGIVEKRCTALYLLGKNEQSLEKRISVKIYLGVV